jgi:hypothetical protein
MSSSLSPRLGAIVPAGVKLVMAAVVPSMLRRRIRVVAVLLHHLADAEVLEQAETSRVLSSRK